MKIEELLEVLETNTISIQLAMETLVALDYCPALIYDECGFWALSMDGLSYGAEEGKPTFIGYNIDPDDWQHRMRGAIIHAIKKTLREDIQ